MDVAGDNSPKVMWKPDRSRPTKMDRLRKSINEKYGVNLETYQQFHRWSCDHYAAFWEEVWKFTGVISSHPYKQVVDSSKNISEVPEWFQGARLNYAENLLRYNDDRVAIYAAGEGRSEVTRWTYKELRRSVGLYASAMKKMGVKSGDRVVGYIPNCVEAVEAMLAAASIGAIWSSTSPDFGVVGVLERFCQIRPKLIFSVNAVNYNGRMHNHLEKLQQVVRGLPDLEKVIIVPFVAEAQCDLSHIPNGCLLEDFLNDGKEDGEVPALEFEQVPFNHPLFIMYSSGTTGAPKCMVHSAGAGWMMWNWMVSVLAVGAAIVLYDDSPLVPHPNVLWDLVDQIGITVLGTGAKWLAVLEEKDIKPGQTHKLTSLKMILSTGSPLKPQSYDYVYRDIKSDLLLGSITVYWRSEGKCTISANLKNVQTDPKSKVFYGVLRNVTENAEHYIYFKEIGLSLIHHRDRKAWHEASDECFKENATLFVIDNQKKQDVAKRLVKFSGHDFIFIGVYRGFPYWRNCDGKRLNYTSWAPREPHLPCFAALGRFSDYLWVTTGQHDKASYICKR